MSIVNFTKSAHKPLSQRASVSFSVEYDIIYIVGRLTPKNEYLYIKRCKMRTNRDSQRSKVYKAENQVFSFKEEKLETMAQAQLVVNEVINSDYYKSNKYLPLVPRSKS